MHTPCVPKINQTTKRFIRAMFRKKRSLISRNAFAIEMLFLWRDISLSDVVKIICSPFTQSSTTFQALFAMSLY